MLCYPVLRLRLATIDLLVLAPLLYVETGTCCFITDSALLVLAQVCAYPPVIFEVAWSQSGNDVDQDLLNWTPGNNGVLEGWAVKIFPQKRATHGPNIGQWVRRMQFHRYLANGIAQPVVRTMPHPASRC